MFIATRHKFAATVAAAVALSAGVALRLSAAGQDQATPAASRSTAASGKERFFEMRTYHAADGKVDALDARFRDHTNKLFQKHGIDLVGYWHPVDKKDVLVYILAYPSRGAREQSWKAFNADPEWQAARNKSEENGKLVTKVESAYMTPTDYSPIK